MRKYKYILFDLDGTLIFSHEGIYACVQYALEKMGKPKASEEVLRACIGPVLEYSFSVILGLGEEESKVATKIYRERYREKGVYENSPIEGALETLKTLSQAGYILGLATSKPQVFSDKITKRFGFSEYLTAEAGCGLDGSFPTKADVIREAIKRLGATAEECLMVGDRKHDAEGAREVGMDCALLRIGYGEEEERQAAAPKFIFDGFSDLIKFLTE